MSNDVVNIDELAAAIAKEIEEYQQDVDEKMKEELEKIADETARELREDPNVPASKKARYKKSFYVKSIAEGKGYKRLVVANKKYQLTHLLEYGHMTRNGKDRTRAFPHWATAEKRLENKLKRLGEKL